MTKLPSFTSPKTLPKPSKLDEYLMDDYVRITKAELLDLIQGMVMKRRP